MATPEEIVRVGRKANTMEELEAAVRKFAISGIRRGDVYDPICVECGSKSIITIDGADTCTQCGTSNMNNFTHYVSYNNNKDDYLKKKSHHKRVPVGLIDTYSRMLLPGIGIPYGSSSEA